MNRIFIGMLIGIFLCVAASFMYRTYWLRDYTVQPVSVENIDTTKMAIAACVNQMKSVHTNYEEKFNSVSKRLDDFLVFGGMIITLLLAVTVSVYLKTETEVSKHFKENFEAYEKRIVDSTNKVEQATASVLTIEQLFSDKAKKLRSDENNPIT
jgi:hypothetical protein